MLKQIQYWMNSIGLTMTGMTVVLILVLPACYTSGGKASELYKSPKRPVCVGLLGKHGWYDYRLCSKDVIGYAWVIEKRLREKYEEQIRILQE